MKKILIMMFLFAGLLVLTGESYGQDNGGGKSKKSKKSKGMGSQEDLDAEFQDGKERMMSKEDKKNLERKKKEVAAKRKKDEVTRARADKIARKRLDKTKKSATQKKKRWVKSHGG